MISASASRLNLFLECPYKFRLEYIDKIKVPEGDAQRFGAFVHKILELFVKCLRNTGKARDPQFINDNLPWLADGHKISEENRMRAREILAIFLSRDIDTSKIVEVEALVGEDFPKIDDVKVWAKFDRLDVPEEGMV